LHKLAGFEPGPISIMVPRRRKDRSKVPGHLRSTRQLSPSDAAFVDGFRCTSATRTVIDLAANGHSPVRLGNAIDSAVHLGLTSPEYLGRSLDRLGRRGRPGVRVLDELLLDSGGHSYLERRFLRMIRESGLPRPGCQVTHHDDGKVVARVDFEWTSQRVVVEVNGRFGHSSRAEQTKDARRRNALQQAGFIVVEFTTTMVVGDPGYVLRTVRESLASRGGTS
jgi:Protein of unknown function (DUF559)